MGLEALYLSLEPTTAIAEYQQTSRYLPPGTLCSYTAHLPPLVDLRLFNQTDWHPIWRDWTMNWRQSLIDDHVDPPTWDAADMAIEAGHVGIIFPSMVHRGGTNVVLFLHALSGAGTIEVNDPNHVLPHDDASWR
jgi:RES domain-containing protein